MHARTVSFPLPPDKLDQALTNFKEGAERVKQHPGFQHVHWLYDREHERVLAVAFFDTAEHAEASWAQQGPLVLERLAALGITPEVHTYDVVHEA